MSEEDCGYYRRRADIELAQAQQPKSPEVVAAHYKLAEAYLERIASADPMMQSEHV